VHDQELAVTSMPTPDGCISWSAALGRTFRTDGPETIGISSQTLAEQAIKEGRFAVGSELGDYFHDEMTRINSLLYLWLVEILCFRMEQAGVDPSTARLEGKRVVAGLSPYRPGEGDLDAFRHLCEAGDGVAAMTRLELMRVRTAAVHDHLVFWIQELLTDLAERVSETAVRDAVVRANETFWGPRYASWDTMSPLERLQLSVEGMRGHLSGFGRRGDVGVIDEPERYVMVLDPCGSCGVLRRGDPDSGRPPCNPHGTKESHSWAQGRIGYGWYAVHSPIILEWLPIQAGRPPMRPVHGCDTDGPCRWFIYKDPTAARLGD
jgi:hypothetical protein